MSLRELFEIDIENYYALVCREFLKGDYFNSGVLMINSKLWRDTNIEEVFCEYYDKNYINYKFPDQDLLNDALKGKVKIIDKKWNFFPVLYYKPLEISINDYMEANKKSIIHYIMYKPWDINSTALKSIFLDYYWYYYMFTPWSNEDTDLFNILIKQNENTYKDMY